MLKLSQHDAILLYKARQSRGNTWTAAGDLNAHLLLVVVIVLSLRLFLYLLNNLFLRALQQDVSWNTTLFVSCYNGCFMSKSVVIFGILMTTKEVHFWATFPISQLHLDAFMSVWTTYSPCMAGDHVMLWTGNNDDRRWLCVWASEWESERVRWHAAQLLQLWECSTLQQSKGFMCCRGHVSSIKEMRTLSKDLS